MARDLRWADVPGVSAHRVLASEYRPADGVTRVARELGRLSPATRSSWSAARTTYGRRRTRSEPSPRAICWTTAARWTTGGSCSPTRTWPGTPSGSLGLGEKYGAVVSRVRRGDFDMLAHDDLLLQLDDRVRVVMPRERTGEVTTYLGDTEAKVSEVSAVSLGLGLTLGFLIGIPSLTLGSTTLALGTGAGPLVMGMVLGWRRTGPLVWTLPTRANLTLRQIGLLLFLAVVGLTSGYSFRENAFSLFGLKLAAVLAIGAVVSYALMVLVAKALGQSRERTMGLLSGYVGNPAIVAYANSRASDSRINNGYSTLFALAILVKIVCIQLIVGL